MIDVLIIGAGVAGLTAAYECQSGGLEIVVLEANVRIGGRVHSAWLDHNYVGDLGPSWVWPPWQPVASQWLKRLGISTFSQYEEGAGVLDFPAQIERYPLPAQSGIARIEGGPQSLVSQLSGRLDPQQIRCGTTVNKIVQGAGHLQVHALIDTVFDSEVIDSDAHINEDARGESAIFHARQVILAVPLRKAAEVIQFEPGLPADLHRLMLDTPTWMAAQSKVVAHYAEPFWRDAGLSGRVASRTGPLTEIHDHSGEHSDPAALFGFIGLTPQQREDIRDDLPTLVVEQLQRCFGIQAATPLNLWIEDWALNKTICSAFDLNGPATHPEAGPDSLRQSQMDGALHLAVAEVSVQSPGLLDGALNSGQSAAEAVLRILRQ